MKCTLNGKKVEVKLKKSNMRGIEAELAIECEEGNGQTVAILTERGKLLLTALQEEYAKELGISLFEKGTSKNNAPTITFML